MPDSEHATAPSRARKAPEGQTDQDETPYLDALAAYAQREPARLHVPGHGGGPGADPRLREAIGEPALRLDIPALTHGIDVGVEPTPFQRAQDMAARAWDAKRTWFMINGASQGNLVASLALAHLGGEIVVQRNAHSSAIDGLVLSGLRPSFVAPELDPELHIAHCVTPETLDAALRAAPGAVGAAIVSPTYFGAVADVRGLADAAHSHGVPLVVDEAWGAHFPFHQDLPEPALSLGADLVVSSTHKMVGSLTQSAMLHLGWASEGRLDESVVDRAVTLVESTSPSALLSASLDAARRQGAVNGERLYGETLTALAAARERVRALPGLDVLDERLADRPGVAGYDPLRLAIDVRGTGSTGYALAPLLRDAGDVNLELAGENVMVAVFSPGAHAVEQARRLLAGLESALERVDGDADRRGDEFAPPPPWGPLAMSPREAFFGPQEVVPVAAAVGRVAAESLAAYPPGIPNVLPGERLTAETLDYVQQTLEVGGSLRGASDRRLRSVRVVVERG
jgi:arginine decarboxylase